MTTKRAPWVKWYPDNYLNGVVGLSLPAVGAYSILLSMIYDNGGPIRDDVTYLARRMGVRPSSLEKVLDELVQHRKVVRTDGVISNQRAEKEIENRSKIVEILKNNFHQGDRELPEKQNKINGSIPANGSPKRGSPAGIELDTRYKNLDRKKEKAQQPRPPGAAPKAARIDPRRQLSSSNIVFAKGRGLNDREIKNEWAKFLAYYRGLSASARNSTSPDWDAVWESWVLRACERLGREPYGEEPASGCDADPRNYTRDGWVRLIEMYRKNGIWHPHAGPEPGKPGCLAPPDLVNPS